MADATNHDKFLMTVAYDKDNQMVRGRGLPYHEHKDAGKTTADNHIETYKCIREERCQRTLISSNYLIHDQSHIGNNYGSWPSWYKSNKEAPGAPPVGNGIVGHKVQYFAIAADKSPDVMVEGHWSVREFDKSHQDNSNGPGEFIYNSHEVLVPDDSFLVFAQCGVERLKLACSHKRETVDGELHVFIGEKVTITAYRVNAAETDPKKRAKTNCDFKLYQAKRKPPKEETQHAVLVLTRKGQVMLPGVVQGWDTKANVTMIGTNKTVVDPVTKISGDISEFTLGEEWLLKLPKKEEEQKGKDTAAEQKIDKANEDATKSAKEQVRADKDAGQKQYEQSRNTSPTAKSDAAAAVQARDAAHAQHKADVTTARTGEAQQQLRVAGKLAIQTYQAFVGLVLFEPLQIEIASHGCSKGPAAIIKAYVPGAFAVDLWTLTDFPLKNRLSEVRNLIQSVVDFLGKINNIKMLGADIRTVAKAPLGGGSTDYSVYVTLLKGWKKSTDKNAAPIECEPKIAVAGEWKELEHDGEGEHAKNFKKWMVKRALSIDIGIERLVGLKFVAKVSLLDMSFLVFVEKVLHYLGVDSGPYIEFNLDLGIGVAGKFEWTEYGHFEFKKAEVAAAAQIKVELYVQLGTLFKGGIRFSAEWDPKFELEMNEHDQACVKAMASEIDIKGTFFVEIDITIWKGEVKYDFCDWPIHLGGGSHPVIEQNHH